MEANELMIGDFVFHEKYGNAIIENVDNDFGDNPSVKLISENIKHKDGYKSGYCWCDLDEIFPIPLTPEILEKNGFTKGGMFGKTYYLAVEDFEISVYFAHVNTQLIIEKRNGSEIINILNVEYLHILQHALKLCGIEKTIEL